MRHRVSTVSALTSRLGRLFAVLVIAACSLLGPQMGTAHAAGGFDCTEVPSPQFPNAVFPTVFDSNSAVEPPHNDSPTGYQTYGWAGLRWYTYDLGCGSDLIRATDAVSDTAVGNAFLTVGQSFAAIAFWLDDQTKTGAEAAQAGITPALDEFDKIVSSISSGMLGVYGKWLGLALMCGATYILWNALKANSSGVTKTVMLSGAAITLGALLIGAPQKAMDVADETFGQLITGTQGEVFHAAGLETDPRNVLLDKILLPDISRGWFGPNYDDSKLGLQPKLRDTLAFSYAEQEQVESDPDAANKLAESKAQRLQDEIIKPLSSQNLSYYQFQGKDSGRTSTGFLAMVKVSLPSILWAGASILKIIALLAIRFAILFAPMWVPFVVLSGGFLERVMRMIGTAYLWGVAGATIVALYLVALVKLYYVDDGVVDGSWRLWFMVILSLICWFILRPFKRVSGIMRQNSASLLNRKAVRQKSSLKEKAFGAAQFAIAGPTASMAEKAVGAFRRSRDTDTDSGDDVAPVRPEGRGLITRRQQDQDNARVAARSASDRLAGTGLGQDRERDARIAGIAAASGTAAALRPKSDLPGNEPGSVDESDTDFAIRHGREELGRIDAEKQEAAGRSVDRPVQHPSVREEWNGGTGSVIAPMKVYTPERTATTTRGVTPMVAIGSPPRSTKKASSSGRDASGWPSAPVWTPPSRAVDRERLN
jgi:hypothetical protein